VKRSNSDKYQHGPRKRDAKMFVLSWRNRQSHQKLKGSNAAQAPSVQGVQDVQDVQRNSSKKMMDPSAIKNLAEIYFKLKALKKHERKFILNFAAF
jgi:hypothetical protein